MYYILNLKENICDGSKMIYNKSGVYQSHMLMRLLFPRTRGN